MDKELLEAAARAAKLQVLFYDGVLNCLRIGSDGNKTGYPWSPLVDDGDAFRLAAGLYLHINHFPPRDTPEITQIPPDNKAIGTVEVQREGDSDPLYTKWYKAGEDVCAATRYAITRAAASIGPPL